MTPEALASAILKDWPIDCDCEGVFCEHGHAYLTKALTDLAQVHPDCHPAAQVDDRTLGEVIGDD